MDSEPMKYTGATTTSTEADSGEQEAPAVVDEGAALDEGIDVLLVDRDEPPGGVVAVGGVDDGAAGSRRLLDPPEPPEVVVQMLKADMEQQGSTIIRNPGRGGTRSRGKRSSSAGGVRRTAFQPLFHPYEASQEVVECFCLDLRP
jgi:hypothetical protein